VTLSPDELKRLDAALPPAAGERYAAGAMQTIDR